MLWNTSNSNSAKKSKKYCLIQKFQKNHFTIEIAQVRLIQAFSDIEKASFIFWYGGFNTAEKLWFSQPKQSRVRPMFCHKFNFRVNFSEQNKETEKTNIFW